jgi:hypothetical protein
VLLCVVMLVVSGIGWLVPGEGWSSRYHTFKVNFNMKPPPILLPLSSASNHVYHERSIASSHSSPAFRHPESAPSRTSVFNAKGSSPFSLHSETCRILSFPVPTSLGAKGVSPAADGKSAWCGRSGEHVKRSAHPTPGWRS